MRRLDALYPAFGFASHVGYITPAHSAAVRERGPCPLHRRSFNALCYAEDARRRGRVNPAGAEGRAACQAPLLLRGYRVLAANAARGRERARLVVRRGRRLVFCEVKTAHGARDSATRSKPSTPEKERRVRRAAEGFLARHPELAELDVALEAAAVRGRRIERVPL